MDALALAQRIRSDADGALRRIESRERYVRRIARRYASSGIL
jgi:hypothetical protein